MKKLYVVVLLFIPFVLAGCSASVEGGEGMFHTFLVNPLISMLEFNAHFFHGNYGLSIILMTFFIRLVLLPLTMKQYKSQRQMKEKMAGLQPEMCSLQEKIKQTKDPKKQQQLQQEIMMLYKKHDVNPLNMGCLPLLIQMPILMSFYFAIKDSHSISTHSFLWYNLGEADIIMALIAGVIYYFQFRVSLKQMPVEQQSTMKMMGLLSPAMILFVSLSAPAALPLYWSMSGLFMIVQTALLQRLYKREPASETVSVEVKN